MHNIKVEKVNAKLRYRRLQKITALFRLMELCIFFFIVSRFTTQLPIAFKVSGEYFRGLSVMAVSPRFVFIIGNAIVIVLFLKSGQLSPKDGNLSTNSSKFDLYEEYVKNCEKNQIYIETESRSNNKKQRKRSPFVSREVDHPDSAHSDVSPTHSENEERKTKINRSHSENLKTLQPEEEEEEEKDDASQKLRRSLTVRYRESVNYEEKSAAVGGYAEDEMSGEEFRRAVEAFIARQQRFLREED